jgi:hypothetical protein
MRKTTSRQRKTSFVLGVLLLLSIALIISGCTKPSKPKISRGEFSFTLDYVIDGEIRSVSDTRIAEFDGYNLDEGRGFTRKWKQDFVNNKERELFSEYSNPNFPYLVIEDIGDYKIVLGIGHAAYFMGEDDEPFPGNPYIGVVGPEGHLLSDVDWVDVPEYRDDFLAEHGFEILSWICDPPLMNNF